MQASSREGGREENMKGGKEGEWNRGLYKVITVGVKLWYDWYLILRYVI